MSVPVRAASAGVTTWRGKGGECVYLCVCGCKGVTYQPVERGHLVLLQEIDNGDFEILPLAQGHKVVADVREVGQVPRKFLERPLAVRRGLCLRRESCPLARRRGAPGLAHSADEARREERAVLVVRGHAVGGGEEGL